MKQLKIKLKNLHAKNRPAMSDTKSDSDAQPAWPSFIFPEFAIVEASRSLGEIVQDLYGLTCKERLQLVTLQITIWSSFQSKNAIDFLTVPEQDIERTRKMQENQSRKRWRDVGRPAYLH